MVSLLAELCTATAAGRWDAKADQGDDRDRYEQKWIHRAQRVRRVVFQNDVRTIIRNADTAGQRLYGTPQALEKYT